MEFGCLDGGTVSIQRVADPCHVFVAGAVPAIFKKAIGDRALAATRLTARPLSPRVCAWEAQHDAVWHHARDLAVVRYEVTPSKVLLLFALPHLLLMLPHGICRIGVVGSD